MYDTAFYAIITVILVGLERPVCNERRRRLLGKVFKTSDKFLTLRLRGHPATLKNVTFRMVMVSFHDGKLTGVPYLL